MTCIVGLVRNGILSFGGDTISVSSYNKTINRDSKVFQRNGLLFGTCGSIRMRNLLQYRLEIPEYSGDDPMAYLVNDFLEAVRHCFKVGGFVQDEKGRESIDGRFLLGFEHELYVVGSEYNIIRPAASYCAIGAGEEYAYGSLHATQYLDIEPLRRMEMALQAAAYHNTDVSAPFTFITSQPGEKEAYQ